MDFFLIAFDIEIKTSTKKKPICDYVGEAGHRRVVCFWHLSDDFSMEF